MLRYKGVAETKLPWSNLREGPGTGKGRPCPWDQSVLEATDLRKAAQVSHKEHMSFPKTAQINEQIIEEGNKKLLLRPVIHYVNRSPLTRFSICCSPLFIQCVLLGGVCQKGEREVGPRVPAPSCDGQLLIIFSCLTLLALVPYPASPK